MRDMTCVAVTVRRVRIQEPTVSEISHPRTFGNSVTKLGVRSWSIVFRFKEFQRVSRVLPGRLPFGAFPTSLGGLSTYLQSMSASCLAVGVDALLFSCAKYDAIGLVGCRGRV